MLKWALSKIVGNKNQREVKRILPLVVQINEIEERLQKEDESVLQEKSLAWKTHLNRYNEKVDFFNDRKLETMEDEELRGRAVAWAERFAELKGDFSSLLRSTPSPEEVGGFDKERLVKEVLESQDIFNELREDFPKLRAAYLDEILPEAYAVVKNAARRLCGTSWNVCDHPVEWQMVHFDVQLIGGIALHRGLIAEMATGEGKTLVATLPTYLNALTGLGVHVVTVNDYLARRDGEWMGHVFEYLGLSIGIIQSGQYGEDRSIHYQKDITYGTASEFGFDYLRDNGMARSAGDQVQSSHYYSLIDEVDSVLIDEARTPLIISGPVQARQDQQYDRYKPNVDQLVRKQTKLCNEAVAEAKKHLEEGKTAEAGEKFFLVKLGAPRNRQLMRAMEDAETRRLIEKTELSYYQDAQKTALFELKEHLYFVLDEKQHDTDLTDLGRTFLNPDDPEAFTIPDIADAFAQIEVDQTLDAKQKSEKKAEFQEKADYQGQRMHAISQLLRAFCVYEKDVHYVVEDNKVQIVDENTGRKMSGRRWSDGLHQAVEAKEGVKIEDETQTYATITIQNYFRLYEKLGGMTGTAETEASEFKDIYDLDVLAIPTNRPIQRIDQNDHIYKTQREKFNAVIELVKERHEKGQPILLGTASVQTSEVMGRLLKREKIPHNVLNAKYHLQEAEIVERAGLHGAVTVATNMAGRGTDIKLGEGVKELGGLMVIGTERHQSRRIDRQLRGRCARQGDPGETIFYVSFEDPLMVQFGAAERMTKMMERFGLEEGQELEHPWLNKAVTNAQTKVEQRNYQARKHILEYDDVMNKQREVVYGYRNEVLTTENPHSLIIEVIEETVPNEVGGFLDPETADLDYTAITNWMNQTFPIGLKEEDAEFDKRTSDENIDFLVEKVKAAYELKSSTEDPEVIDDMERFIVMSGIDRLWQEHLYEMDGLRDAIRMRQYAQKDPLVEYKNEAYKLFTDLMDRIKGSVLMSLFRTTTRPENYQNVLKSLAKNLSRPDILGELEAGEGAGIPQSAKPQDVQTSGGGSEAPARPQITLPIKREIPKVGRNEACPCGSGKKFKSCHGKAS